MFIRSVIGIKGGFKKLGSCHLRRGNLTLSCLSGSIIARNEAQVQSIFSCCIGLDSVTVSPPLCMGWEETRVWVERKKKETSVLTIWVCYHSSFKYWSAGSKSIFSPARNLLKAWSIFRGLRDRL